MITQQAKDHAQACYDATKEAATHSHMGDAQKAAYMTILANHKQRPVHIPPPSPRPPQNRHLSDNDDCQCPNCTRARSIKPLVGGYQPCSGYEAPEWDFWTAFPPGWYGVGSCFGTAAVVVAIVAAFKHWG
jgi:hypothetical protein